MSRLVERIRRVVPNKSERKANLDIEPNPNTNQGTTRADQQPIPRDEPNQRDTERQAKAGAHETSTHTLKDSLWDEALIELRIKDKELVSEANIEHRTRCHRTR